ncbi:MAG: hypothetical protein KDD46_02155 [Bdellovibrionales bacterium]|nr:hypothetical protein [Bdellovibrionales bacterium]
MKEQEIRIFEAIQNILQEGLAHDSSQESLTFEDVLPSLYSLVINGASLDTVTQKIFTIQESQSRFGGDIKHCRKLALQMLSTVES